MTYEIGSHFEYNHEINVGSINKLEWLPSIGDSTFTFSGRTAIELAIKDIQVTRKVENVYMPSYCCSSMVEPFINNGMNVMFYDVDWQEQGMVYNIDPNIDCDIFFVMSYFGVEEFKLEPEMEMFSRRKVIIIEDITHRLLSDDSYSTIADYSIASIRKWLPVPTGGYIVKHKGLLLTEKPNVKSDELVENKIKAMKEKKQYLDGHNIEKKLFLNKYGEFENALKKEVNYYKIDTLSLNLIQGIKIGEVRAIRRKNAKILYKGLKKLKFIKPLIPNPNLDNNCPLFVPIIVANGKRDHLRKFLIDHNIYCPVHWPQKNNSNSKIPKDELSIVCDQRYNEEDMEYILSLIEQWCSGIQTDGSRKDDE